MFVGKGMFKEGRCLCKPGMMTNVGGGEEGMAGGVDC